MTPVTVPDFTVAPDTVQVPTFSGDVTPLPGSSATHSALEPRQVAQVSVTLKLLPEVVASVTLSAYFVPVLVTEAVILSPGFTVVPTTWMSFVGYISHQV